MPKRRLTDLPLAGRQVRLVVVARRFRCDTVLCGRRIFTERFDDGALAPWARRTARLDLVVHHLGLALGGRPAASFARHFGWFEGAGVRPLLRRALSASTTGPGGAISGTERSSATSSGFSSGTVESDVYGVKWEMFCEDFELYIWFVLLFQSGHFAVDGTVH